MTPYMPKKGDTEEKGPSERIQFRLKPTPFKFAKMRAASLFDGDLTEYIKYLIIKDKETCPNDAQMWLKQIDDGIADLEVHIVTLRQQKEILLQQIQNDGKKG